jgi:hypothetical protein
MIGYEDLTWTGNELRYRGRTVATRVAYIGV